MGKIKEEKTKQYRKRQRVIFSLTAVLVVAVCMLVFVIINHIAKATVTAPKITIKQGEELPTLQVKLSEKDSKKIVLDKKKKYTVEDFFKDLEVGKGYTIKTKADPAVEGSYKTEVVFDKNIQKKLDNEWKRKVKLTLKPGKIVVKNPIGEWEGEKFKRYDGSYVTEDFVVSKGKTYYFDADGNMATGIHKIGGGTYAFDEKGVMKTGWQKDESGKYYMGKNGAALIGWQEIKGKTYYFDADGKMATGKLKVGLTECEFNKKGELVSKKESSIDPKKPMVALTFDDGPGKRTGELLAQLEKYNAHATFFMLGQNVSRYPDVVKKMKEIGCELGNHSYSHKNLAKASVAGITDEVGKTNTNIAQIAGEGATVMRPPYGAISDTLKATVGMPMILWNIDTLDWKTRNAQKTIETTMNNVDDGDIILLHDIHTESVDAALKLIPMLEKVGYQLVTVSELAAAKGVTLENGGRYTDF